MAKYTVIPPKNITPPREFNDPPFSIPGVSMPHWETHDQFVPKDLHQAVHKHLLDSVWHQYWFAIPSELQVYRPSDWDDSWINAASITRTLGMPRTLFGSDLASTRRLHPIIAELWDHINQYLGDQYEITGPPEDMFWDDYPCPATEDTTLEQGWRVYANATTHDLISLNGHIHRDTVDLYDETSVTMLWIASEEWYPSWGGELILYPEDPEGRTGDHQQFSASRQQRRNYKIGWQDDGKMITMRPGRLIIYDGRTLHSLIPSRHRHNTMPNRRVAFRARKKNKS